MSTAKDEIALSTTGNFPDMSTDLQGGTGGSMASSFRGRNTAMSAEDLRKARESRAADALRMKDEQLKILTEQNASLLKTLDKVRLIYF